MHCYSKPWNVAITSTIDFLSTFKQCSNTSRMHHSQVRKDLGCSGGETKIIRPASANSCDTYETIVRNSRSRVILNDFRQPKQLVLSSWNGNPMGYSMLPHCRIRVSGCLISALAAWPFLTSSPGQWWYLGKPYAIARSIGGALNHRTH